MPPFAEPYEYVEPPYPMPRPRVEQFEERSAAELAAWRRGGAPAQASKVDGLLRALLRPEGIRPSVVQVLIDPVSGWSRTRQGELLPPSTLRQVLKSFPGRGGRAGPAGVGLEIQPSTAADLTRRDLNRSSSLVTPARRELLGQLDGERCRFPSCDRTRHLHAHHVRFWRDGGPTDLANLIDGYRQRPFLTPLFRRGRRAG